jgi:hypothetical protein
MLQSYLNKFTKPHASSKSTKIMTVSEKKSDQLDAINKF